MSRDDRDDLLDYYERELLYLRNEGAEFARRYPKIAARLELSGYESPDPHSERLLESFAFLTARIQRTLDADFPLIPSALLEVLYPQLAAPVPSMAIAQIAVDPDQARSARGFPLRSDTALFATAAGDRDTAPSVCRMRTAYTTELWPIEAVSLHLEAPDRHEALDRRPDVAAVLRLRLKTLGMLSFSDMSPGSLRLYLDSDPAMAGQVYELLVGALTGVLIQAPGGRQVLARLPPESVQPVGFADDEMVLPFPSHMHQAYRLIREYFVFPQKFLFLDVQGLGGPGSLGPGSLGSGQEVDLLFLLNRVPDRLRLERVTVRLNCTPIVNLFPKTTEPVRLDHSQSEYRLPPDSRWERTTEIHSIVKVSAVSNPADDSQTFRPYFSYDHAAAAESAQSFWLARRKPSSRGDMPGTDLWLSFVDLSFHPSQPPNQTVFAHTLCTNRGLAEQLPPGAPLEAEVDGPIRSISCLNRPTRQIAAPERGETLWRLVSALSLNHLSITGNAAGIQAFREMLTLYSHGMGAEAAQQTDGILLLDSRSLVRRVGGDAWRGFVRGTEITMLLEESKFVGGSPFLLAAVLDRFLALYAGINSFTQLILRSTRRDGEWMRWPPRAGARTVL